MAAPQGPFLAAVLVLVSSLLGSSSSLACLQSCTCQSAFLLNCSSAGLSSVPQHIQDSVTELDFSHNLLKSVTFHQPHYNLRSVWLGNNGITRLSLCTGRNLGGQHLRDTYRSRPWNRQKCVPWAPTLQLLSVEMNQLRQLPEGLEGIESLEVLQLSFNRISTLQLGELSHLQQLKELHLQHNLITSLHPQMFQDLPQLKVLDLSFNMLTSIHPLMYLTLQNIGTDVRLLGNRWQCDCRMHSLRRRIAFDSSRGLQVWSIMCASPSTLSGRDLLQLQDDDLNCLSTANIPELHQDVTVQRGSEILLSCSAEDSVWWTPNGKASVNQPDGGLLISDITESDTGLYVCVSKEKQVVSVFNLQISQIGGARRKPRSLSETSQYIIQAGSTKSMRNGTSPGAGAVTQSDLALAVCLSIFITFLIAFILGVLARPCIDALWKRVTEKNINTRSREANSAVSVEQTQYDNEAFSTGEELEMTGHHRERRVTFTTVDYREDANVQYYDTVASGNPESIYNNVVIDCEVSEAQNIKHTPEDSGNESSSHQSISEGRLNDGRDHTSAGHRHNMKFEPIPDPAELEEKRSLSSSSSDSSLSEKEFKEHHTMPKAPKVTEDPFQQKTDCSILTKVEVPQKSLEGKSKMPGFTSEPWSPHTTDPGYLEENEELFEFSDSVQSPSPRSGSIIGSSNKSKLTVATPSKKHKRDSVSSSSSNNSEDEPTVYKANCDQQIKPAVKPEHSFSSDSSDSDKEPDQNTVELEIDKDSTVKVKPKPRTKWRDFYSDTSQSKNLDAKAPSPSIRDSSSSSSDSEADSKVDSSIDRISQFKEHSHITAPLPESNSSSRSMRKDSDIKEPSSASSSSSSSESDDETGHKVQQSPGKLGIPPRPFRESQTKSPDPNAKWPTIDLLHIPHVKRRLDIKAPSVGSDTSSSSESEEETIKKQEQGGIYMPILPNRSSQKINQENEIRRPAIPPERPRSIKKDSDVKEPSSASSSSSSESEDEIGHKVQQIAGKLSNPPRPFRESQTKSPDPNAKWPTIDLLHIPHIKRRLDIKAPSVDSDTSSSSDSEKETVKKQDQGAVHIPILPNWSSQKASREHDIRKPAILPERPRSIKKDSDIKEPSSASSSSSSCESEDETDHKVQQSPGKLGIASRPFRESQTKSPDPNAKWPTIDLLHIPHIKRRLDIKAPSIDSDTSSSESEEETIKKQNQGGVHIPILPNRSSQKINQENEIRRPAIPPERPRSIKKDSDIKEPSSASSSSSSSESEDETDHKVQQSTGKLGIPPRPFRESQTKSPDPNAKWPTIDLLHIPHIKRRLDIKAPSVDSDTSSSSDSEKETVKKQDQGAVHIPILPNRSSQKASREHDIRKPAILPERPRSIKKDSDIKEPSSASSSSSSESEDEIGHKVQQIPGKLSNPPRPFRESQTKSPDPNAKWPTIDLLHIPHIKRRLDIKAPSVDSDTSSSSESEEETIKKQNQGGVHIPILPNRSSQKINQENEIRRPAIPPERPRSIKKDADIKEPSSASSSSSSSESEDETDHKVQQSPGKLGIPPRLFRESQTKSPDPNAKWPTIDLLHIPHVKRRLDIKAPSVDSDTSSSSESEEETTKHIKKQEQADIYSPRQETDLLYTKTQYVHHTGDIKSVSSASESSSSSDSEDEKSGQTKKQSLGSTGFQQSQTKRHDPVYTSSSSDEEGMEDLRNRPVVVKPDSRLPEMGLTTIPYVKKRLDIKTRSPKSSSSSDESEGRTTDQPVKMDSNLGSPNSTLFKFPHISNKDSNITLEKYVVITDELRENRKDNVSTTPEINSELQSRWATMNLGVSRFRKRLEITSPSCQPSKLPSSPPPDSPSLNPENKPVKPSDSSSSSSSEDELTENRAPTGMTYVDFPIYKRSIMKTSSLPDNSFSPSGQMVNVAQESEKDRNSSLAPKRVSSVSFEDEVRRRIEQRHNANVDIPPEIKWTGVGHNLSKISTPALKTGLNTTPPQQASPAKPELAQLYSSSIKSDVKIKQDSWKSDVKPTHKFSSISTNSTSSASGGALHRLYNSPNTTYENPSPLLLSDMKERKGLSALKAMSSERRMWDVEDFSGDVSPTVDDHSPQADTGLYYRKSEPDNKPLPALHLPSASSGERRATDLLYNVPRYRTHDIKPPQVAPPPIPVTLPPEEAVGLTWRSPQDNKKQGLEGNRSYQQQRQNTEEPVVSSLTQEYPPIYLNTSNITHV
ncbi:unnamed protein product [Oreochromis niloticus]|nr:unnamed protein product [Mustela putorius furo]